MARSTAVAKRKTTAVADVAAKREAELEKLRNKIAAPSGDRIQVTQDKLFKLPNGESADMIQCVIVDFISANYFYESAYVQGESTPPTCFALNPEPAEMAPSPNAPEAQDDKCATCWANQFGSAGKGKACQNSKLLAVLPPDATDETPLMLLKVSPTALKRFDTYVGSVARQYQRPPKEVITEISFDPNVSYASLTFSVVEVASDEIASMAYERNEEALERLMVEPDLTQVDAKPAPAARGRGVAKPRPRARKAA